MSTQLYSHVVSPSPPNNRPIVSKVRTLAHHTSTLEPSKPRPFSPCEGSGAYKFTESAAAPTPLMGSGRNTKGTGGSISEPVRQKLLIYLMNKKRNPNLIRSASSITCNQNHGPAQPTYHKSPPPQFAPPNLDKCDGANFYRTTRFKTNSSSLSCNPLLSIGQSDGHLSRLSSSRALQRQHPYKQAHWSSVDNGVYACNPKILTTNRSVLTRAHSFSNNIRAYALSRPWADDDYDETDRHISQRIMSQTINETVIKKTFSESDINKSQQTVKLNPIRQLSEQTPPPQLRDKVVRPSRPMDNLPHFHAVPDPINQVIDLSTKNEPKFIEHHTKSTTYPISSQHRRRCVIVRGFKSIDSGKQQPTTFESPDLLGGPRVLSPLEAPIPIWQSLPNIRKSGYIRPDSIMDTTPYHNDGSDSGKPLRHNYNHHPYSINCLVSDDLERSTPRDRLVPPPVSPVQESMNITPPPRLSSPSPPPTASYGGVPGFNMPLSHEAVTAAYMMYCYPLIQPYMRPCENQYYPTFPPFYLNPWFHQRPLLPPSHLKATPEHNATNEAGHEDVCMTSLYDATSTNDLKSISTSATGLKLRAGDKIRSPLNQPDDHGTLSLLQNESSNQVPDYRQDDICIFRSRGGSASERYRVPYKPRYHRMFALKAEAASFWRTNSEPIPHYEARANEGEYLDESNYKNITSPGLHGGDQTSRLPIYMNFEPQPNSSSYNDDVTREMPTLSQPKPVRRPLKKCVSEWKLRAPLESGNQNDSKSPKFGENNFDEKACSKQRLKEAILKWVANKSPSTSTLTMPTDQGIEKVSALNHSHRAPSKRLKRTNNVDIPEDDILENRDLSFRGKKNHDDESHHSTISLPSSQLYSKSFGSGFCTSDHYRWWLLNHQNYLNYPNPDIVSQLEPRSNTISSPYGQRSRTLDGDIHTMDECHSLFVPPKHGRRMVSEIEAVNALASLSMTQRHY